MVYDGAVKDQESAANTASASAAVSEASGDSPAASEAAEVSARPSSRPSHDKRLGVRHPLKHRRFRAGGKMMVEPGGVPPARAPVEGEEEEASDVEEEEEASSAETEMQAADVEVSSAPAAVVQEMEVEGGEMEASPEPAVTVEDTELEAQPDEEDEVSSMVVAQGETKEAAPAASTVLAVEAPRPKEKDQDKEREEKEKRDKERERQKERERVDEVGYMSGGWKSVDGSLNCGYSSFRGKRASMEDFYDIKSSKIDDKQISLFGIFDGETYRKTDSEFLDAERNSHRDDGSTASTAVLVGDHLYVANVGDSRAVISKAGKAIALSEDHKPNRSDERKRIESAGGIVMWAGKPCTNCTKYTYTFRVLAKELEIDDELEFLIIASDGLWDVVPNEDAVSLVKMEEPEAAARKLTETAFSRGSGDNITCIVVKFQHDKPSGESPSPSGDKS
ncbi:hypothetical protein HU200_026309 [Digitaria exilis]|uniref:protein-serine/threonine phosphatase n=1 Tax=Digitaria exilis TaxID=1010633 RepID=A0A835ERW8_9POAL|nr:hypothetical protein HU200_026309 [Digitaria exilis]